MKSLMLALYRIRGIMYYAVAAVLIGNVLIGDWFATGLARSIRLTLVYVALALFVVCILLIVFGKKILPQSAPREVMSPVAGRWMALNSPATDIPSHGVRMYGQAYAIDLVHEPAADTRPEFGEAFMRTNAEYPAFGQPVHAMVSGTVVKVSDWRRDHRARSNPLSIVYMMIEGALREVGGPGNIVGNHVVIRTDDGVFAAVAHLKRGSAQVSIGDVVAAGQVIGSCGNSGNSSEPHVHAQLMDRASFWTGQGIPFTFANVELEPLASASEVESAVEDDSAETTDSGAAVAKPANSDNTTPLILKLRASVPQNEQFMISGA
ncbi:M23 family metallopeptidase [Populibacterium corticicola]|uniref:M23 family metallopeptidase n=1 Tax=Populibacterium corticicola TaxID=1812826 RepID=A0ABW5XF24_9MICO